MAGGRATTRLFYAVMPDAHSRERLASLAGSAAHEAGGRASAPDTLHLTGSVTFVPSRVSHVGPRMQGRIREVMVEIGSPIAAGDTLAVLDSPELGVMQAAWFQASVARDVAMQNHERVERLARDGIASERRRLEAEAELRQREAEVAAAERGLVALGAEPDSSASSLSRMGGPAVMRRATLATSRAARRWNYRDGFPGGR